MCSTCDCVSQCLGIFYSVHTLCTHELNFCVLIFTYESVFDSVNNISHTFTGGACSVVSI